MHTQNRCSTQNRPVIYQIHTFHSEKSTQSVENVGIRFRDGPPLYTILTSSRFPPVKYTRAVDSWSVMGAATRLGIDLPDTTACMRNDGPTNAPREAWQHGRAPIGRERGIIMQCQELRRGHQRPPSPAPVSAHLGCGSLELRVEASVERILLRSALWMLRLSPAIFSSSKLWRSAESIFHSVR